MHELAHTVGQQVDHDDLLDALGGVRLVELAADQARRRIVLAARLDGYSWTQIGDALGVSKQAAWERFGDT